jgi:hypothetical protein
VTASLTFPENKTQKEPAARRRHRAGCSGAVWLVTVLYAARVSAPSARDSCSLVIPRMTRAIGRGIFLTWPQSLTSQPIV